MTIQTANPKVPDPAPGDRQTDPMRVVIADDHGIVRSGVRMLLERQA